MPLPADSILPLLPHTNLGESEHTQPKQALIIRLSEEVLDALQSYGGEKPPVEFAFGKSAGIYIGGTFYPMNGTNESGHELYLRTTSAKQHAPPLRHYANVTHKYAVELGQRDEAKAADRARQRAKENAKQKEEQKTVLLDTPPPLTPSSSNTSSATVKKKKKDRPGHGLFVQAMKNSEKATSISRANANSANTSSTPTPTAATRVASPAPSRKREDLQDHPRRKPLIHCLAVNVEKSRDQLTKMILGSSAGNPSSQQDFYDLLEDVAEPTATLRKGEDPGNQKWRLKTESWPEVRPFEWPKWGESDRIAVARTGRQKLHALGMGPSDALWKHFEQPRQNTNNPMASTSSNSSSNSTVEPKRGLTSTDVKEKKKVRTEPKEIQMRDEGARAKAAASVAKTSSAMPKPKVKEESPIPAPIRTGAGGKKLPGSGYKASSLASPAASPSPTSLSAPKPSDPRSRPGRDTPSNALPPKPSSASTTPSAKPDRNPVTGLPNKRIGKTRDVPNSGMDSDRERASDRMDTGKSRSIPDKGKGVDSRDSNSSLKRKQAAEDDDDDYEDTKARALAAKKRKVEGNATPISTPPNVKDPRGRDLSLPKRPELTPGTKPKPKKEASPLPPLPASPKVKKEREQSPAIRASMFRDSKGGSSHHRRSESVKTNGSGKSRRRSPIYTSSSEDEGEIRRPSKPAATTLPTPSPNGDHSSDRRPVKREPIPTDHAAIRVRYQEAWSEYYELYGQLRTQRLKIEKQMTRGHPASDSGEEILSNDELVAKNDKYQQLFKDLSTMREILGVQ